MDGPRVGVAEVIFGSRYGKVLSTAVETWKSVPLDCEAAGEPWKRAGVPSNEDILIGRSKGNILRGDAALKARGILLRSIKLLE